jgi:hypothetical protein
MRLSGHPAVRVAIPALSVALAVVGAAATSRAMTDRPSEAPPAKVLAVPAPEVRSITVESGGRQVSLARTAEGTWTGVAGASPETVSLMSDVEGRLFPLQGYRSLAADAALPEFGLASPEITFRVTDTAGREHTVLLGAATFTNGGVYARRSAEGGRVYLVPRRMMDDLRSLLTGKRIDTPNDLPEKLKENTPKHDPTSWWLRQAEAGGAQ